MNASYAPQPMPINAMTRATTPLDGLLAALRLSLPLGGDARADAKLLAQVADLDGLAALATRHRVRDLLLGGKRAVRESPGGPLAVLAEKLRERSAGLGVAGVVRRTMGNSSSCGELAASLDTRGAAATVRSALGARAIEWAESTALRLPRAAGRSCRSCARRCRSDGSLCRPTLVALGLPLGAT